MDNVFNSAKVGEPVVFEDDENDYVVERLALSERADLFDDYQETLLKALKQDDFDALVAEWFSGYEIAVNDDAVSRYDPSKMNLLS